MTTLQNNNEVLLRDMDLRRALRRSLDAKSRIRVIAALSVMLVFMAILCGVAFSEHSKERQREAVKLARMEEECRNDPENMTLYYQWQIAQESMGTKQNNHDSLIGMTVLYVTVVGGIVAYYIVSLCGILRHRERYRVCRGRLTDPTPGFGRNVIYFTAKFSYNGQCVSRNTRSMFSSATFALINSMTDYNNADCFFAYDPEGDRLVVLGRTENFWNEMETV